MVTHDRYFLDKVATKVIVFEDEEVRIFFGNYTDYLDEKKFLAEMQTQSRVRKIPEERQSVTKDKQRMSYLEKQEWAKIEEDIAIIEAKIAEIESAMLECGSDFASLSSLQKDLDMQNNLLLEKYERYEYLSELEA